MSTKVLSDYVTEVGYRLEQPTPVILSPTIVQSIIDNAAVNLYSKHRPFKKTNDITGNGTYTYTINATNFPGWSKGFSEITRLEYPADEYQDPNDAEVPFEDWMIYEASSVEYLRFTKETPSASYKIRVEYTTPHAITTSTSTTTIYDNDFSAVCDLAACIGCRMIAAYYGHSINSTIGADAVDYRNKSDIWSSRAKNFWELYMSHMFPETSAAMARREFDTVFSDAQMSRLTHLDYRR